jgi:hypothetical protein
MYNSKCLSGNHRTEGHAGEICVNGRMISKLIEK